MEFPTGGVWLIWNQFLLTYKNDLHILRNNKSKLSVRQAKGGKDMSRFFVPIFLTIALCLSVSPALAGVTSPVSPNVTGPIVKSANYCNTQHGWRNAKYNGRDSCVFCDEKNGWRYAKFNGKDSCVRCNEESGWRYDGSKFCVKKVEE